MVSKEDRKARNILRAAGRIWGKEGNNTSSKGPDFDVAVFRFEK
jgi:hypothetical protein